MTWFKVDDKLHSHSKIRKVLAEAPAALALWTVAGSWSADNLTDGFVPDHQLPWLIPSGADDMARQLVAVRLWKRVRGGYQFHAWTEYQPEKDVIEEERKAARERMRKLREDRRSRGGSAGHQQNGSGEQQANVRAKFGRSSEPPTRPDPKGRVGTGRSLGERSATRANTAPPSPRCEQHLDVDDPPPCGPCADARRARTRWDLADAERRRTQPQCRTHRGQPAHNCGLCRADALALEDS